MFDRVSKHNIVKPKEHQKIRYVDATGIGKGRAITRGGLRLGSVFLYAKKSADSIVIADTSRANETDKQGGLTKQ